METTALVAAFIAAIVAGFGIIIQRGTKVSEFRQAWINDQRSDLAIVAASSLSLVARPAAGGEWAKLHAAVYRIILRNNPKKQEWAGVLEQLRYLRRDLEVRAPSPAAVQTRLESIAQASNVLLKREWDRVRTGELGYRMAISLAPFLFAALLMAAYYALFPQDWPFGGGGSASMKIEIRSDRR